MYKVVSLGSPQQQSTLLVIRLDICSCLAKSPKASVSVKTVEIVAQRGQRTLANHGWVSQFGLRSASQPAWFLSPLIMHTQLQDIIMNSPLCKEGTILKWLGLWTTAPKHMGKSASLSDGQVIQERGAGSFLKLSQGRAQKGLGSSFLPLVGAERSSQIAHSIEGRSQDLGNR